MNGGGVSRSIKFGSIGYLNNDDGMRGRSVITCILDVGTVPMRCVLNVGTVPTFNLSLKGIHGKVW